MRLGSTSAARTTASTSGERAPTNGGTTPTLGINGQGGQIIYIYIYIYIYMYTLDIEPCWWMPPIEGLTTLARGLGVENFNMWRSSGIKLYHYKSLKSQHYIFIDFLSFINFIIQRVKFILVPLVWPNSQIDPSVFSIMLTSPYSYHKSLFWSLSSNSVRVFKDSLVLWG